MHNGLAIEANVLKMFNITIFTAFHPKRVNKALKIE